MAARAASFLMLLALSAGHLAISAATKVSPGGGQSSGANDGFVRVPGHTVSWATDANFRSPLPPDTVMHARLHVGYSSPAEVAALAAAVSDPASPLYGQFLTPEEFQAKYAPSAEYIASLEEWATNQGFRVCHVPRNRKFVSLEGTAAQFSAALRTEFGLFNVNGKVLRAPKDEPALPAALFGNHHLHFTGLDHNWHLHTGAGRGGRRCRAAGEAAARAAAARLGDATAPQGCVWDSPTSFTADPIGCGYLPGQVRSAYNVPANLQGDGQTIAIVDGYASPYAQSDLDTWSAAVGLPSTTLVQVYPPLNYSGGSGEGPKPGYDPGSSGEEALDIQAIHGIAPNAKIVYVGVQSLGDANDGLNYVLDNKLATIISNSYGRPLLEGGGVVLQSDVDATDAILQQAAVLGVGVYFSSGDSGDYSQSNDGTVTPSYPAASPYGIAVGGTTLAVDGSGNYVIEYGWGANSCDSNNQCTFRGGAGGGVATNYATPSFQSNLNAAQTTPGRLVPDVAAFADEYTGFFVGLTTVADDGSTSFGFSVIGGTSLACPAICAMVALLQQQNSKVYGFSAPYLYSLPAGAFNDVQNAEQFVLATNSDGSHVLAPYDESLVAGPGWDNITGLGTPNAAFWSQAAQPVRAIQSGVAVE